MHRIAQSPLTWYLSLLNDFLTPFGAIGSSSAPWFLSCGAPRATCRPWSWAYWDVWPWSSTSVQTSFGLLGKPSRAPSSPGKSLAAWVCFAGLSYGDSATWHSDPNSSNQFPCLLRPQITTLQVLKNLPIGIVDLPFPPLAGVLSLCLFAAGGLYCASNRTNQIWRLFPTFQHSKVEASSQTWKSALLL